MQYKGVIRNKVVVLEEGISLPERTEVIIIPEDKAKAEKPLDFELVQRKRIVKKILSERTKLEGITTAELVRIGREEHEKRYIKQDNP